MLVGAPRVARPATCSRLALQHSTRSGILQPRRASTSFIQEVLEVFGDTGSDPGHWNLSPEWFGTQGGGWGRNTGSLEFCGKSQCGNGTVSVTSHPADPWYPQGAQQQQQQEWRVLRFNADTRQSVNRVTLLPTPSNTQGSHGNGNGNGSSGSLQIAAVPQCLAWPYLKVMAATAAAVLQQHPTVFSAALSPSTPSPSPLIVCIGLGGGTLPLFLSHHFPAAAVVALELDPVVVEAARSSMGLGVLPHNLTIVQGDGAAYVQQLAAEAPGSVSMLVVDAFDGEDNVPKQLYQPGSPFLAALPTALHPKHGSLLINLHAEGTGGLAVGDKLRVLSGAAADRGYDPAAPKGRQIVAIGAAYSSALLTGNGKGGTAFTFGDRYGGGNVTAVVARGVQIPGDHRAAGEQLRAAAAAGGATAGFSFDAARYLNKFAPL